jgi:hypothetical protein
MAEPEPFHKFNLPDEVVMEATLQAAGAGGFGRKEWLTQHLRRNNLGIHTALFRTVVLIRKGWRIPRGNVK